MNTYAVVYKDEMGLFAETTVITGKNPKEALHNAFGKNYEYVTGDRSRYANVILVKVKYSDGAYRYGRYQQLCYIERKED